MAQSFFGSLIHVLYIFSNLINLTQSLRILVTTVPNQNVVEGKRIRSSQLTNKEHAACVTTECVILNTKYMN